MNKVVKSAAEAVRDVPDGATVMVSGFGLCGIPENLINALRDHGAKGLTVISNNAGVTDFGIELPAEERPGPEDDRDLRRARTRSSRRCSSTARSRSSSTRRAPSPSGSGRAGPASPPSSPPPATARCVAEGKEVRWFAGKPHLLETGLRADFALVKAWKGDTAGQPRLPAHHAQLRAR